MMQAFANAWKKACETSGGVLSIPKGTFLVSSGVFRGPCIGQTRVIIDGILKASRGSSGDKTWLTFNNVDGLTISGAGTIDGNGASAWSDCKATGSCGNRPSVSNICKQFIRIKNCVLD